MNNFFIINTYTFKKEANFYKLYSHVSKKQKIHPIAHQKQNIVGRTISTILS